RGQRYGAGEELQDEEDREPASQGKPPDSYDEKDHTGNEAQPLPAELGEGELADEPCRLWVGRAAAENRDDSDLGSTARTDRLPDESEAAVLVLHGASIACTVR